MAFHFNVRHIITISCLLLIVKSIQTQARALKNEEVLKQLGLKQVHVSPSHHRKRLAVESRHHQSSDDSHMYVIKLPPNPYYYLHHRSEGGGGANSIASPGGKKVPVGFKSNGKPAKVYHWNIPVLKKIATKQYQRSRLDDSNEIDHVGKVSTITKVQKYPPVRDYEKFANEVHDKITNVNKMKYQKSPSFYAPVKAKKGKNPKNAMIKFHAGNGKPKSFYVIEKNKKYYHKLLP